MALGKCRHVGATGKTAKIIFISSSDQFFNNTGSAFEAYNVANIATYGLAMAELGGASTTGIYSVTVPAAISSSDIYCTVVVYTAGASLALSDFPASGTADIDWTGTSQVSPVNSKNPESYPTLNGTGSNSEMLYAILQHLEEASISGTVKTVKKRDAATTAETLTLNSSTSPTSVTRTT